MHFPEGYDQMCLGMRHRLVVILFVLDKRLVSFFRQTTGYCYISTPCIHSANRTEQMAAFTAAWIDQTGVALSDMHSEQSKTLHCGPG